MCVCVQESYPDLVQNARGQGTFCAVDASSVGVRDKLVALSRNSGMCMCDVCMCVCVCMTMVLCW